MTEAEYEAAVKYASEFPWRKFGVNRYPSWNAEYRRRLAEVGLRLEPSPGDRPPPKDHYITSCVPMEDEPGGWPESWVVEA